MTRPGIETIIEHELPNLPGWCTPEKGKRLAELARGAGLCVELGVFGGRSLVAIALTLRIQGYGRADGIDPYTPTAALEGANDPANDDWWSRLDYEAIARAAQEVLYRLELVQCTRLIRMTSCEVFGFYKDGTIDLLHQDSNHSEEITCEEVTCWAPKIRSGGHWIFDDTNWPTTQKAQKRLLELGFVELENHESWKVYKKP